MRIECKKFIETMSANDVKRTTIEVKAQRFMDWLKNSPSLDTIIAGESGESIEEQWSKESSQDPDS